MKRGGYLVLDIETIPDPEHYSPPPTPMGEEKPFPPVHAHRPVAIGALWLTQDLGFIRLGIIGEKEEEAGQLAAFSDFVDREAPTLVTWNGRAFDLPVLVLRSLHHGVAMGWYYQRSNLRYRFSDEGHLDLADALSDRGATRMTSLDNAARLIGLPGKMGVDGSQVEGYFKAGRLEEIRHYCLTDVIQTTCLLCRYLHLAGREPKERVLAGLVGLLSALESDGRFGPLLQSIDRKRLLLGLE